MKHCGEAQPSGTIRRLRLFQPVTSQRPTLVDDGPEGTHGIE
jgi:hypothetical protein